MSSRKLSSTFTKNEEYLTECNLSYAISKIGGRWKLQILGTLENGSFRFSDLKKKFPMITERMLTLQLKSLEKDGLIKRTVYPEVPIRVEYTLTDIARELSPILHELSAWGARKKLIEKIQAGLNSV
jgi:DNA-binding HxlR family transcriptional regulator